MFATEAKSGEVWKTNSRKGLLTVRFLSDVDTTKDAFVEAEIIEGAAKYLSTENRFLQKAYGKGMPGHTISMRMTLITLIERISEAA